MKESAEGRFFVENYLGGSPLEVTKVTILLPPPPPKKPRVKTDSGTVLLMGGF